MLVAVNYNLLIITTKRVVNKLFKLWYKAVNVVSIIPFKLNNYGRPD